MTAGAPGRKRRPVSSLLALIPPPVMFFALGFGAGALRADVAVPEALARALSVYLMVALGLKGGAALAMPGAAEGLPDALAMGVLLSFLLPLPAFALLRAATPLERETAAAVAGHHGSVSVVTFAAASGALTTVGVTQGGFMPAVLAAMETPAILTALLLARLGAASGGPRVAPLTEALFPGALCLFLLEMGLMAVRQLRAGGRGLSWRLIAFGMAMPLLGGAAGLLGGAFIGLSPGGVALMAVLAGSASYIAVPAAMRLALPRADAGIYVTLSVAVTFPFNILLGIPLWLWLSGAGG